MKRTASALVSLLVFALGLSAQSGAPGSAGYGRPRVGGPADLRRPAAPLLEGPLYTPFDGVKMAHRDAAALYALQTRFEAASRRTGKTDAPDYAGIDVTRVRYLSLYNVPRARRARETDSVAFTLNSLSRSPLIKGSAALVVPDTDGTLLRVYLDDFNISPKSWDLLAEKGSGPKDRQLPDPYFHATVEREVDDHETKSVEVEKETQVYDPQSGGYVTRTKTVKEEKRVKVKRVERTSSAAPWLALETGGDDGQPGEHVAALVELTQTKNPILRADWFVTFAFWAPRYYDFFELGVEGKRLEKDFEKLVFADEKAVVKANTDAKAVVVDSKVALANRSMTRWPTLNHALGGFYWASRDAKKSIGKSNTMQNLLREEFDAKEIIASLPNGMQVYAVADNKGNLLDLADAAIAQDFQTQLQDKQVYVGRNCASCHDSGMWFIRDNVRRLSQKEIGLMIPDKKDARRVATLFFGYDVKPLTDRDSALFEAAVLGATGKKPVAAVGQFSATTYAYLDRRLTIDDVALEVGVPAARLGPLLKKMVNTDFTLVGLLADPPEPVRRDQWEADGYPQLMLALMVAKAWNN